MPSAVRRASDAWFDDDCRPAKRTIRLFESDIRRLRHRNPLDTAAIADATNLSSTKRCEYRLLLLEKRETFWQGTVTPECSTPQLLWRSVDKLLGRGRVEPSASINAYAVRAFFNAQVADVRSPTDDAPTPAFTNAPPGYTHSRILCRYLSMTSSPPSASCQTSSTRRIHCLLVC